MEKKDKEKGAGGDAAFAKYFKYGVIALAVLAVVAIALIVVPPMIKINVAKIGSENVTAKEYTYFLNTIKQSMFNAAQQENESLSEEQFWNTPIKDENAIDVAKKQAMDQIKEIKIQVIKAKEKGLKLENTELDGINQGFDDLAEKNGGKAEVNKQYMSLYGIDLDDFKEIYKELVLAGKLYPEETKDMQVTDEDVESYYEQNPDKYKTTSFRLSAGEAVWARHILISAGQDATEEEVETARTRAQELLDRVNKGEDFAALAKESSEDGGSAQYGGDYVFERGEMVEEFEETAFSLKPGEVSELVKTVHGFHIIKLEEKYAKDQPVSLKCAGEYREFGLNADYLKGLRYDELIEKWKEDPAYEVVISNKGVYDSIQ